jgi:cellulose synthase/poly-beta-1,6-N-acetylglucosamine synthase-like glycosyltransferase
VSQRLGYTSGSSSEEVPLNWNHWIRQTHRWLSIAFMVAVIVTSVALAQKAPVWVSYLPLPPLFLLMFTGLYLFVLPYAAKWRRR